MNPVNLYPHSKYSQFKLEEEHAKRFSQLKDGLMLIPSLEIPLDVIQIIINYTILYEIIDEIFSHLHYFKYDFDTVRDDLWILLCRAKLDLWVPQFGWPTQPKVAEIRRLYFYKEESTWRKTFDPTRQGRLHCHTFAQCVMKRLDAVKRNVVYTYFKKCLEQPFSCEPRKKPYWSNPRKIPYWFEIKLVKIKQEKWQKEQVEIDLLRTLRTFRQRIDWMSQMVHHICSTYEFKSRE